jgi:hypothetical protein
VDYRAKESGLTGEAFDQTYRVDFEEKKFYLDV